MSQSAPKPRKPASANSLQQRFRLEYESNGRPGCGWPTWVGIALGIVGVALTIAFGMGWL